MPDDLFIPEGWHGCRLDDCFELASGDSKPARIISRMRDRHRYAVYGGNGVMGFSRQYNDNGTFVIIGRVGENCGCVHFARGKIWVTDNALFTTKWKVPGPKRYFAYLLDYLDLGRLRNTGGQPLISQRPIYHVRVALPPVKERRRMCDLLRLWDRGLRRVEKLIQLKRYVKQGLVQQLLGGRRRFAEFAGEEWRHVRLRDVAEPTSIRNRSTLGRDRVMAVTKSTGMTPMKPELIAGSIVRYQIVERDWFAYNPMRLNIGSIARWRDERPALVSPDYVVFRCKDGELDPDYLDQFRRSHAWSSFMNACGNGSVRVRIWFDDLGAMRLQLPPLAEQRRIAAVLATADRELELLEQLLTALRQQKKGLMQKLLTGQVRVTTDRGGNGNGDV